MTVLLAEDSDRDVAIEVLVEGGGEEDVVLVPSAQRGAADFSDLQQKLSATGYRSFAVNPRNAGRSRGPREGLSLRDIADDVALVVNELGRAPAHLVGHAAGNIAVRATATYRPEVAATVTVMPCGGHDLDRHPVPPEVLRAFPKCHDPSVPEEERIEALRTVFFAPGNDPAVWLDGWWPGSGGGGLADPEEWWRAGTVPVLIIQPMQDAMAPPEVGREAAVTIGDRATYVEIESCGHAILPEQPRLIAEHVVAFLRAHPVAR